MNMEGKPDPNIDKGEEEQKFEKKDVDPNTCPNCRNAQLNRQGACIRCPNCGYYSCGID